MAVRTVQPPNYQFGEPFGLAVSGNEILVSDGERGTIDRVNPGELAPVIARDLKTPSGIAYGIDGVVLITDSGSHSIKKLDRDLSKVGPGLA
ncbi:MAG TPA: hypothetical protein PLK77_07580, partial [Pyrinomonadaceae bacterium]|nr:hypothetical protein [Pyrinomonadaceae bacterium]